VVTCLALPNSGIAKSLTEDNKKLVGSIRKKHIFRPSILVQSFRSQKEYPGSEPPFSDLVKVRAVSLLSDFRSYEELQPIGLQ
jgi:hypothetical protein